jgi:hypothetical protein
MYDESRKDPDWIAYRTDLMNAKLNHLRGQYVAYSGGKLLTSAPTKDELLRKVRAEFADLNPGAFIQKVGIDEVVHMPTFTIEEGK